jgi:hypothetical protein
VGAGARTLIVGAAVFSVARIDSERSSLCRMLVTKAKGSVTKGQPVRAEPGCLGGQLEAKQNNVE